MSKFILGSSVLFPNLSGDKVFRIVGECVDDVDGSIMYYCLGYDDTGCFNYSPQYDTLKYWEKSAGYSFVEDASTHKHFAWLAGGFMLQHGRSAIAHPEQRCVSCKRPAPHVEPNRGNEFVCSWCSSLQKLDLVI